MYPYHIYSIQFLYIYICIFVYMYILDLLGGTAWVDPLGQHRSGSLIVWRAVLLERAQVPEHSGVEDDVGGVSGAKPFQEKMQKIGKV